VIPRLNKFLCIANDPILAAMISSCHNEQGEYFSVLEAPRIAGYYGEAETIRCNNTVVKMRPEKVIFAGLQPEQKQALKAYIPARMIIEIDQAEDIDKHIGKLMNIPKKELVWPLKEAAAGLFLAKSQKKRLRLTSDSTASCSSEQVLGEGTHVVICEVRDDVVPVIAANYAYSIDAKFTLIPEPTDLEVRKIEDQFYNLYATELEISIAERSKSLRDEIKEKLKHFTVGMESCITFITKGIPYGFVFPEVPSSHLISYPTLGLLLNSSIRCELENQGVRVALLVDPGFYPESEVKQVAEFFRRNRVWSGLLFGDSAKVFNVGQFMDFLPYDFLMISAHAGEISGRRAKLRLRDKKGTEHELIVDIAAGFGLIPGKEKVDVHQLTRFVSIDGVDWEDTDKKKEIDGLSDILQDLFEKKPSEWDLTYYADIARVRHSMALKMTDHYLLAKPTSLANTGEPIVLNNACCSWYEMAARFIFSGARTYIGTLYDVTSVEAAQVATSFIIKHQGEPSAFALWQVQNEVYGDSARRPYILIGPHFTTIKPTTIPNAKRYLLDKLREGYIAWNTKKEKIQGDPKQKEELEKYDETVKFFRALLENLPKTGV